MLRRLSVSKRTYSVMVTDSWVLRCPLARSIRLSTLAEEFPASPVGGGGLYLKRISTTQKDVLIKIKMGVQSKKETSCYLFKLLQRFQVCNRAQPT